MALSFSVQRKIAKIGREAEERDARKRAEAAGYPYMDFAKAPLSVDVLGMIPQELAEKAKIAVFAKKRQELAVAVYSPTDPETQKILKDLEVKNFKLKLFVGSLTGLKHIWEFYQFVQKEGEGITGKVGIDEKKLKELSEKLKTLESAKNEIAAALETDLSTRQLLEILLAAALTLRASDIHFEPEEKAVRFRLRIDGLLHDIYSELKISEYFFLIARIKLLSALKLNIRDIAQDGRFTIGLGAKEIEIRVSVIPSEYGETAVMRILDPETIRLELKDLGLRGDDYEIVQAELERPNGMILNTGPTGSGKTTTLYAFLLHVNKPESKLITIEDPIEYRLPGVEQTQVNPDAGYTFATGLRAIVRQDPDVVLVGEIRDLETAEIALNASLTGHLVFSTLHTNDSFGAIPRLIDLGAKAAIIGPALNLIIAQRLVRRLCEHCKTEYQPSAEIKQKIQQMLAKLPKRVDVKKFEHPKFYKPAGCGACASIGYKGRIAVFELFRVDDEIEQLIYRETSEVTIREKAQKQGIVTLQQDGIFKVLDGVTTFEEVERVTGALVW